MRNLFIYIFLIGFSFQSLKPSKFTLVKDTLSLKTKIDTMSKQTITIESDFVQEKDLTMLSEKIISKGRFWFQKENKLRWEYVSPFDYTIVINGEKMLIKDDTKIKKYDLNSNKMFKEINDIMLSCVNGNVLNSNKFDIQYFENEECYLLELTPISKGMKQSLNKIKMYFDKAVTSVVKLDMIEVGGDNTTIEFTNIKLNAKIAPEKFILN